MGTATASCTPTAGKIIFDLAPLSELWRPNSCRDWRLSREHTILFGTLFQRGTGCRVRLQSFRGSDRAVSTP